MKAKIVVTENGETMEFDADAFLVVAITLGNAGFSTQAAIGGSDASPADSMLVGVLEACDSIVERFGASGAARVAGFLAKLGRRLAGAVRVSGSEHRQVT